MPDATSKSSSKSSPAFIPAWLDDYGLSGPEFRVYCHLSRREGTDPAYGSVPNIAKVCRLDPRTVRSCLVTLEAEKLIEKRPRPGRTSLYRTTIPLTNGTRGAKCQSTPDKPPRNPSQSALGHPSQTALDEGSPLKVPPLRQSQEGGRQPPVSAAPLSGGGRLSSAEIVLWDNERKKVLADIKAIRDSYASHHTMTAEDRDEIKRLQGELEDIRRKLGLPPASKHRPKPDTNPRNQNSNRGRAHEYANVGKLNPAAATEHGPQPDSKPKSESETYPAGKFTADAMAAIEAAGRE